MWQRSEWWWSGAWRSWSMVRISKTLTLLCCLWPWCRCYNGIDFTGSTERLQVGTNNTTLNDFDLTGVVFPLFDATYWYHDAVWFYWNVSSLAGHGYEYSFCPYDSARGLIFDSLRHDFVTWFDDLPAPARGSFFPLVVLVPYSWVICGLNVISEKVKLNSIISWGETRTLLVWTELSLSAADIAPLLRFYYFTIVWSPRRPPRASTALSI